MSISGASSSSSTASVPWPAITAGSSYGCRKNSPSRSASACACVAASASVSPCSTTVAPNASVRSTFVLGVKRGITMVLAMPARVACRATAWAWLPADMAITPAARSRALSNAIRLAAPRSLNAPMACRLSSLRNTRVPQAALTAGDSIVGVCRTAPWMRAAAARTSDSFSRAPTLTETRRR